MTTLVRQPLRLPRGKMDWESFGPWFATFIRDNLRFMDVRDENQEPPYNRTAILPTILTYIGETGQATSQRLLNVISTGNKHSTQSAQPLTGVDVGGGAARIDIAAHDVRYGFGTVSYNSGSITGLANSTLYYVYTDDPTFAGGAVTYVSTTNANNVTANSGRYYLGSITTPAGGAGNSGGNWGGGGGGGGNQIP